MIDTLVFDMGNVLVRWDPHGFALAGSDDPADAVILENALFGHPDWIESDRGTYTTDELSARAQERVPERLREKMNRLCRRWPKYLKQVPGADAFVRRVKAAGLGVYLLSNASLEFPDALHRVFPALSLFDGCMVSAHERLIKPDEAIYHLLLNRYDLTAQSCLFVDDLAANVQGAQRAGMQGYVFDGDYEALTEFLFGKHQI